MVVEVSLRTPSTTNDESGEWMVEKRSGFAGHRLTLHFHIIPVRLKISYLSFEFISKAVTKYISIVWVLKEWGNFHSNFGKMIHSILIPARTSLVISGWIEENPKEITGSIIIPRCWYVRTTTRRRVLVLECSISKTRNFENDEMLFLWMHLCDVVIGDGIAA